MLSLKEIKLKDEYRSDTNNITEDFFIPCLENCTEYHRCTETLSIKALIMMATRLDNITDGTTVLRMVIGHRLRVSDLNMLIRLFSEGARLPRGKHAKDHSTDKGCSQTGQHSGQDCSTKLRSHHRFRIRKGWDIQGRREQHGGIYRNF